MKKSTFTFAILMAFTSHSLASPLLSAGGSLEFDFHNISVGDTDTGCRAFKNASMWIHLFDPIDDLYLNPDDPECIPYSSPLVQEALTTLFLFSDLQSEEGGIYCTCDDLQESGLCKISKESSALALGAMLPLGQTLLDEWNFEPDLTDEQRREILFSLCKIKMMFMGGELSSGVKTEGLLSFFGADLSSQKKGDVYYFSGAPKGKGVNYTGISFESSSGSNNPIDSEEIILIGEVSGSDEEITELSDNEANEDDWYVIIEPEEIINIKGSAVLGPSQIKILQEEDIGDLKPFLPRTIEEWLLQDESSFFLSENEEPHEKALFEESQGVLGPTKDTENSTELDVANLLPTDSKNPESDQEEDDFEASEEDEPGLYDESAGVIGSTYEMVSQESEVSNLVPVVPPSPTPVGDENENVTPDNQDKEPHEGVLFDQNTGILGPIKATDMPSEEDVSGLVPGDTAAASGEGESNDQTEPSDEEDEDDLHESEDGMLIWFRSLFSF